MIIEFIGLPGSGKSSLIPSVIEHFREKGIGAFTIKEAIYPFACRTLLGKTSSFLLPEDWWPFFARKIFSLHSALLRYKFGLTHRDLLNYVIKSQKQRPPEVSVKQRRIPTQFYRLIGYYEFLKSHAGQREALIFDEGFVHKVVQLNASDVEEPNPEKIFNYLSLLPQPDLVIHVKAPLEVSLQRVFERGVWPHLRHKTEEQVKLFLTNAYKVVDLTTEYLYQQNWPVIEVDNSRDDLWYAAWELRFKLAWQSPEQQAADSIQTIAAA